MSRSRLLPSMLLTLLCLCAQAHTGVSAQTENLPLPEYYGLYAVVDGKLCGIGQPPECSLPAVEVKLGRRTGVGNVLNREPLSTTSQIKAIELRTGIRFIVYRENPSSIAGLLQLVPMVFVHNITVDAGWPSNVRRSGLENAWDSGNPSELGGEMNKLNEAITPIEMLIKPLKAGMVLAVPSKELTPGLYRLQMGQDMLGGQAGIYFFSGNPAKAESLKCVDATHEYAMQLSKSKYTLCPQGTKIGASGEEMVNSSSEGSANGSSGSGSTSTACNNAGSCAAMAQSYLTRGQYREAQVAWDKVLELEGSLNFLVCHETGFRGCQPGSFLMSTKEISFVDGKSQQIFSVSLSEVEVKGAQKAFKDIVRSSPRPFVRFRLKVSGKDYNFVFKPMYIPCTDTNPPTCDEPGLSQQETVANYIARKLESLKTH